MNFEKEVKLLQLQVSDILRKIKAKSTSWGQLLGDIRDQKDLMRYFGLKQDLLKSGRNLKTLNGESLLGSGNLDVNSTKLDKIVQVTGQVLSSGSWVLVSGLYEYDYANINITATSIVDVIPDNTTIDIVVAAEILPKTLATLGTVKFYSKNLPAADIDVTINIIKN